MATFNMTPLANDRVLVKGFSEEDPSFPHSVILDATEFNMIQEDERAVVAGADFDAAIESFFAPLTQAAGALQDARKPVVDPAFMYVVQEPQEGQEARPLVVAELDHDTVVLRMLHEGDYSRLLWVALGDGKSTIEILALNPGAPDPVDRAWEGARAIFEEPVDTDPLETLDALSDQFSDNWFDSNSGNVEEPSED